MDNYQSRRSILDVPGLCRSLVLGTLLSILGVANSSAQIVSDVYNFQGNGSSQNPMYVTPERGRDGRLYGTTGSGGASNLGTAFGLTVGGVETIIYDFGGTNGTVPTAGLLLATNGNFYGTALAGGTSNLGVLFRLTPKGTYTVLHNFAGGFDGESPDVAVIEGSDGNLYGTTYGFLTAYSTVYKYQIASGSFTTLYQFTPQTGYDVSAPVIQGTDGNLYGTASHGGAFGNQGNGCGTIFKLSRAGKLLTDFKFTCNSSSPGIPEAPLVQASDGNFYGTTAGGGNGTGTIFKMNRSGGVSTLYSFKRNGKDGTFPAAGLVQATDRNLYGVTVGGGAFGNGTLFQITTSGVYRQLYSFNSTTGTFAFASLMQDTNGLLYGTASNGGQFGFGSVYSLDMGLGPFVTFVLPSGKIGYEAEILGQGLTGTTSVTFNGVSATFTVVADTYMTAVVPSGATTGPVVVTTPTGTLTSNRNFTVR